MNSHELREAFLRFFEQRDHRRMPGAPIVPPGDPTLLFTSAGMVQFKPYFMGQAKPPHPRLVTVQKCFRTTDIEEVGDTSHLTFFEMLGNFSVGDYFKAEIIPWAWEFYTQVLKLTPDRLWPAVYLDDDEAYDAWVKIGVPRERIKRYGEEYNYWFSGEIGPCGPDSEIYYDFGEQFGCGPSCEPAHDCGRFLEIWNLVFMSFYCDGEQRTPLPSRNVDTGAGLERNACVLLFESEGWPDKSKLPTVYDTDLFLPIIRRVEELSGKRYGEDQKTDRAMRIVAEHARAVTFLIGDERTPVVPSNEERGYVVRRMLRRAVYFGRRQLGVEEPFMAELADAVVDTMAPSYPELHRQRRFVREIIGPEERRFDETLSRGLEMVDGVLAKARSDGTVSGADVFVLHDTYGFPVELTREIAAENGLAVDEARFTAEMERQRERARAGAGGSETVAADALYSSLGVEATRFSGYDGLEKRSAVVALVAGDESRMETKNGGSVDVLLAETPFYPEGGGQVGDRGEIVGPSGRFLVEDTQRVAERLIVHRGRVVEGQIAVSDTVTARVDAEHRVDTMRNHTATHLLHAALRKVLGSHVRQAGSLVAPDHLRFDFTHTEAVGREQLAEVERLVNEKVRQNLPVHTRQTTFDQAMSEGVLAFFGDKYGEEVRVVEVNTVVPRFSAELCGGTHCERTGDVGLIIITGESSIGSGMRRIEALSGRGAQEFVRQRLDEIEEALHRLGGARGVLLPRIDALISERDALAKKVERMEKSLATAPAMDQIVDRAVDVDGVKVLSSQVDLPSMDALRYSADAVRKAMPSGVAVLGSVIDGLPKFVAMVSQDVIPKGPQAGEILKRVAAVAGGGGGGRPDMAQGGGKDPSKIAAALAIVPDAVREMLAGDGSSGEG
jgi:alanyl-tRNA synthetase